MSRPEPCQHVPSTPRKRVLCVGSGCTSIEALIDDMAMVSGAESAHGDADHPVLRYGGAELEWVITRDVAEVAASLRSAYVNLLLIDLRWCESFDCHLAAIRGLITELDRADDVEQRYGFHRIVVLVSGPDSLAVDQLLIELGAAGVRHVLRQDFAEDAAAWSTDLAFAERVLTTTAQLVQSRRIGKTALCASGGGITGIYFELGALKCLDDSLVNCRVNDFDMMFGISAGAVVTSLLSVGYTVDEIMASVAGHDGGRMKPLTFSLLRLSHLNHRDIGWRLKSAALAGIRASWDTLRGRGRESADRLFLEGTSLVGPPFHSGEFESMLRKLLDASGSADDFRALPVELFVGASDQDARRHVLFGTEGLRHVPISKAVRASLSVNPAFSSVDIDGRYYEDGAITRTSNFGEAIRRGATLVVTLDPFIPYVSKIPGVARRRGVLYNIDQDIRTISFTRFERARNSVLRMHPEVSSYTMLPSNTLRRLLSMNPMDHRPYLEIWRGSYLSALQRIDQLCHRLRGDAAEHGIHLDTARAEVVAEQLRSATELSFRDFFIDRRVAIRQRPFLSPPKRLL